MRIILLSGSYPPDIGGPSIQTRQLAKELRSNGHKVIVLTIQKRTSSSFNDYWVCMLKTGVGRGLAKRGFDKIRSVFALHSVISRFKPDIVHCQTPSGKFGAVPAILCKLHHIPSLAKYAADSSWQKINKDRTEIPLDKGGDLHLSGLIRIKYFLFRLQDRFTLRRYTKVWATTPEFKEKLVRDYGLPKERIWLNPNFIDLDNFKSALAAVSESRWYKKNSENKPRSILMVSRLVPWKRIELVIDAIAILGVGYSLRIVGASTAANAGAFSPYELKLRQQVQSLDIQDRVEFVGRCNPETIGYEYQKADIFVLPSLYEPFGIVLIEAMASGVPIVASSVGGIPYVVDYGDSALLVPEPCQASDFASAIKRLESDPALARQKVGKGVLLTGQYDIKAGCEKLHELYRGLVEA